MFQSHHNILYQNYQYFIQIKTLISHFHFVSYSILHKISNFHDKNHFLHHFSILLQILFFSNNSSKKKKKSSVFQICFIPFESFRVMKLLLFTEGHLLEGIVRERQFYVSYRVVTIKEAYCHEHTRILPEHVLDI